MVITDYLNDNDPNTYSFKATDDNDVVVFSDNATFFESILTDLSAATGSDDFVYLAGWWTDVDIPLGDPKAQPQPPTLRQTLQKLAAGTPGTPSSNATPVGPIEPNSGPQICCMSWQHKFQVDWATLSTLSTVPPLLNLPTSIFGAYILASINTDAVKFVSGLPGSRGILDNATRLFGSHHQKFIVVHTAKALVAYVGSSDFNADRLYTAGDQSATNPPSTKGAPLNDVNVRIVGPAAADILKTFVDRWNAHPDGQGVSLTGASYAPASSTDNGGITVQVTHTYGAGYPTGQAFPTVGTHTAADAQVTLVQRATQYVYYEDQYLIGNDRVAKELDARLQAISDLVVIAVMAPQEIVGDLPFINDRRSDFWSPLYAKYGPSERNRVLVFEMMNDQGQANGAGSYLHNKMTIVDDAIATVGSVNFSNRSWTHDSEIMILFGGNGGYVPVDSYVDRNIARNVRLMRWSRHLGQSPGDIYQVSTALAYWRKITSNHLRPWTPAAPSGRWKAYQPAYTLVFDPA